MATNSPMSSRSTDWLSSTPTTINPIIEPRDRDAFRFDNQLDRHNNLATTLRKGVKIIDIDSGAIHEAGSYTEAAKRTKVSHRTISRAVDFNRTCVDEKNRKITTSTTTCKRYRFVDAV